MKMEASAVDEVDRGVIVVTLQKNGQKEELSKLFG